MKSSSKAFRSKWKKKLVETKGKLAALKVELNARKIILQQESVKALFAFSSGGKNYNIHRLKGNRAHSLEQAQSSQIMMTGYIQGHLSMKTLHMFDSGQDVTFYGRMISYDDKKRDIAVFYSSDMEDWVF